MNVEFTDDEKVALSVIVTSYSEGIGDDIMGALMHTGAFRYLKDQENGVVVLSKKIKRLDKLRIALDQRGK